MVIYCFVVNPTEKNQIFVSIYLFEWKARIIPRSSNLAGYYMALFPYNGLLIRPEFDS